MLKLVLLLAVVEAGIAAILLCIVCTYIHTYIHTRATTSFRSCFFAGIVGKDKILKQRGPAMGPSVFFFFFFFFFFKLEKNEEDKPSWPDRNIVMSF